MKRLLTATTISFSLASGIAYGGCIYGDEDIGITFPGYDWCAEAADARGWNNPDQSDAVPLIVGNGFPTGCVCLAGCNDSEMEAWTADPPDPADPEYPEYISNLDQVRNAALEACLDAAAPYLFNDCLDVTDDATVFRGKESGDPDCLYEVDEDAETGGTGGGEACESEMMEDPESYIWCTSQGDCDVDQVLVSSIWPSAASGFGQSGYAKLQSGGLRLYSVASTDVIYELGFRSGDVIKTVNSYGLSTMLDVGVAILANFSATTFNVSVRRGRSTLSYTYDIFAM